MAHLTAVVGVHSCTATVLVLQNFLAEARKDVALICRAQKIPSASHCILFVDLSRLLIGVEAGVELVPHAPGRPVLGETVALCREGC